MSAPDEVLLWVARAEEDYQLVLAAIRRKKPLTYGATFHAQQCVEKFLKALLTFKQIPFPRIHDLAALSQLCRQNDFILPVEADDLEFLTAFAVEVRYPGLLPSSEDAREAQRIAKHVRRFARKFLGL